VVQFFAVLEKEPDSLWGVYFPDLPGCVAAAETADIALDNAASALREVAADVADEGRSLPEPRSLEELQRDGEVREALSAGAALVAVPLDLIETAAE
jgi:predicted RNase H-like HicB family nuclease